MLEEFTPFVASFNKLRRRFIFGPRCRRPLFFFSWCKLVYHCRYHGRRKARAPDSRHLFPICNKKLICCCDSRSYCMH